MRSLAALALIAFASLGSPQTVADALRGNAKPILAADLPDGYRAVSLTNGEGPTNVTSLFLVGMGGRSDGDPKNQLFISLMGASFVDPDEFAALLDGKRPRIRAYALDLNAMMATAGGSSKAPTPIFAETWIEAGRILQWAPKPALTKAAILSTFGKSDAIGDSPGDPSVGLSNVKQVALGVAMYVQDYDDVLPYAQSSGEAKKIIAPYTKTEEVWKSPAGGRILYNTALSGVKLSSLERPAETLLVWEEKPYPDGSRAVGYVDGHAMRSDEQGWAAIWATELRRRSKAKGASKAG